MQTDGEVLIMLRERAKGKTQEQAAARAGMADTAGAIAASLDYLGRLPLSNAAIKANLEAAGAEWARLQAAVADVGTLPGRDALAVASEALLSRLERLTDNLERGIQAMVV